MIPDLSELTLEQLIDVHEQASILISQLWAAETAEERAAEIEEEYTWRVNQMALDWHATRGGTGTLDEPVPWEQPSGGHNAWPLDSVVIKDGVIYTSLIPANVTVPGDPNDPQNGRWWEPYDPDADESEWAPWTDYQVGDVRTYEGAEYRCRQAHESQPGWTPPAVPALWERL